MDVNKVIGRYKTLKSEKEVFNTLYQQISDFCNPNSGDFNRLYGQGEDIQRQIYDQTAQHAVDLASSSLIGLTANPASRWFNIEMVDEDLNRDTEVMEWCDIAGQKTLNHFNRPESGFYGALKSALTSTLCYGTPAIFFQQTPDNYFDFKHIPLSQIVCAEAANGLIDTVMREYEMTARQIMQKQKQSGWGVHKDVEKMAKEKPDEKIAVIFAIMPREEGKPDALDRKKLPIAGYFIDRKHQHLMHETGYHEHPLPVARWEKRPSEIYGRSPAMTALSNIKTLNVAVRMLMIAIEKQIQPAVFLPDDGTIKKVDLSAGAVNFYDASKGRLEFYAGSADLGIAYQYISDLQNNIRSLFYVDQLQIATDANMTATEVLQRQDEKARLLAPSIGRIQTELLGPLVQRAVAMLVRNGSIATPPEKIQGQEFKVAYVSPINRAQRALDAQNIVQTAATIAQLSQVDPNILQNMDMDKAARELMDVASVTGSLSRNKEEVESLRQQAQQAQQLQAGLQAGEQAATIAEKVSKANV